MKMNDREWFENSDTETLLRSLKSVASIANEEDSDRAKEKMSVIIELLKEKQIKFPESRNLIEREINEAWELANEH